MSVDEMRFWFMVAAQVFNGVVSVGLWLYVRYGDRNQEVDKTLNDMRERMIVLEQSRSGLLRHDDLEGLYTRLNGISRELSELSGEFEAIRVSSSKAAEALGKVDAMQNTLELINRHLLERK